MSSAAVVIGTLRVKAADEMINSVDPDQTAPSGSALFEKTYLYLPTFTIFAQQQSDIVLMSKQFNDVT